MDGFPEVPDPVLSESGWQIPPVDLIAAHNGSSASKWQQLIDPTTHAPYYHNTETGAVSWTLPAEATPPVVNRPAGDQQPHHCGTLLRYSLEMIIHISPPRSHCAVGTDSC